GLTHHVNAPTRHQSKTTRELSKAALVLSKTTFVRSKSSEHRSNGTRDVREASRLLNCTNFIQRKTAESNLSYGGLQSLYDLTNYPAQRTRRTGVEAFGHSSGLIGEVSGFDSEAHGSRHLLRVLRFGNRCVHQDGICAEF